MAAVLYTCEVLGLAASLAEWPWDPALPLQASARSKSCGSTLLLGLELDACERIARIGLRPQACAIGQASAAIFCNAAKGRDAAQIAAADEAVASWLSGEGPVPDWPGIEAIARAREYPARHGAIRLAWQAAREAMQRRA
jgi:NifU-like protein involved in Fe-S cluster formation